MGRRRSRYYESLTARPLVIVVLLAGAVSAQNGAAFDRASAQRDTLALLKELVALDTQNPPGNEVIVARHLDRFLKGVPGIETRILDPGDSRANFIARLR